MTEIKSAEIFGAGACMDCKRRYGHEYGFPDMMVSNEVWEKICPDGERGLLCPSCICFRANAVGIDGARAVFLSGPFWSGPSDSTEDYYVDLVDLGARAIAHALTGSSDNTTDEHRRAAEAVLKWTTDFVVCRARADDPSKETAT